MKRLLSLVVLALTLATAQAVTQTKKFTAAGSDTHVGLINSGVYNHRITWTGSGTRTTCTIKLEKSVDATTWADLIAGTSCTSDGTATGTGYANYVRMTVTAFSGASNTINVVYQGDPVAASLGTVTIDTTGLATSALQTSANTNMTTGCTPYSFVSTASANLTSVVGTAARLCTITAINPGATLQYLRLYNKATAPDPSACSANSDCPVIYAPIPADSGSLGSGFTIPLGPYGMAFSAGIGYSISGAACTVVSTCTDETNAAAGVTLILGYK